MSDASPLHRPAPARPAGSGAGEARSLIASLAPLLEEWLPRQRWFAGKGRPLTGFAPVAVTELLPPGRAESPASPGLLHLLVRARQGAPGRPAGPGDDCYQLLLGAAEALPPHLAPARIGRPEHGPLRGLTVYEGLADPRLATLLLERLRVPGRLGPLTFSREADAAVPTGLAPRLIGAEQSNSSTVYGERLILKLFRRVGPGVNPDLELPRALARAGCARVPAPVAWFEAAAGEAAADGTAEPMTLGVLQPYLAGSTDGWRLALDSLARAAGTGFAAEARALGAAVGEVHLALAEALPTVVLRRPQLEHLAAAMGQRLDAAAEAVPALRPYHAALRETYALLPDLGRAGRTWRAQRIHGDLHLGQVLRTAADGRWSLIDFEGEPARPLAERRRPQPVARDVAGMLRSFDYAAAVGGTDGGADGSDWATSARTAFCEGYAAVHHDPGEDAGLLRAHEIDKAVYEVLYEARHRPDWLPVPLAAVRRLAAGPRVTGAAPA
ncbi:MULTISPECIES: phosphotransferase [Streptomyces]|uniref:Maltokinase n=1 Tax=Streptomyces luteosporeus TaxID=173856 RepID=A0ABN3TS25_9ACTN